MTYPKGHKKEGMPLNKICFIGQSGTGKTSLLNIVKTILKANLTVNDDYILRSPRKYPDLAGILMNAHFEDIKSLA
ncbi:MAG: hypothetical protein VSS75_000235 [Candidatus Parabeggiatoa sp.]|nr:hypothetical protein [Candidatus Parabeggiatoa sp.]